MKQPWPLLTPPAFIHCPVSFLIPFDTTTAWTFSGSRQLACRFGWASPSRGLCGPGWTWVPAHGDQKEGGWDRGCPAGL